MTPSSVRDSPVNDNVYNDGILKLYSTLFTFNKMNWLERSGICGARDLADWDLG